MFGASALVLCPLGADEIGAHPGSGNLYHVSAENISAENRSLDAEEHAQNNRRSEMYIPPAPTRPTPLIRVATGGTRSSNNGFPVVTLLVPEHVALTVKEQPTLYWHISEATRKPVVLTLIDPDTVKPLLEEPLQGPIPRGIHALKLADHGIRLQSNKIYEWSVRVMEDPNDPSGDAVARSFIERMTANADIRAVVENSNPFNQAQSYARNGIWHDALAVTLEQAAGVQARGRLRRARDLLLEQVGLLQMLTSSLTSVASN